MLSECILLLASTLHATCIKFSVMFCRSVEICIGNVPEALISVITPFSVSAPFCLTLFSNNIYSLISSFFLVTAILLTFPKGHVFFSFAVIVLRLSASSSVHVQLGRVAVVELRRPVVIGACAQFGC